MADVMPLCWRQAGVAAALGATATLGLAPIGFWPLTLAAFGGLFLLIRRQERAWRATFVGWCFGFGYFLAGLHWISNAFMTDGGRLAWAAVPAVVALSALMAVYAALAVGLTALVGAPGTVRAVVLAAFWTVSELLRASLFGGFPWNLVGYAIAGNEAMAQLASLGGIHALGFVTVLFATLGAAALTLHGRHRWSLAGVAIVLLAATWGYGIIRLSEAGIGDASTVLRLVQADIPQARKWRVDEREAIIERYIDLSNQPPAGQAPTVILWPESALPVAIDQAGPFAERLRTVVPSDGYLVTGAVRYHPDVQGGPPHPHNSAVAIDGSGRIAADYDKVRLVPFGEFVPFGRYLPIEKMTAGREDFRPGPGPRSWSLPGLPPAQPLICYEAVFPGDQPPATAERRPAWLLNLTNDAWFGASSGPYQHFAMARLRAIERGLPLVRVANGGISAVTDAYGRTVAALPLDAVGILDVALPRPMATKTTYERHGDRPLWILIGIVVAAITLLQSVFPDRFWTSDGT
ncbi:MAG: apolipoprotein N-acyltransferase [Alphaproteobacteria bacterium]|jgi:apolipoprotein N-acyltransferase|nr:apolipoprotein N-acyltransferase [Alphaproteobacteria bacterium]